MSYSYSPNALLNTNQVVILDSTAGSGSTGALVVSGGVSAKDTFVSGHVAVNEIKITPNLNDIVFEQQYSLSNDVTAWTNIPSFTFDDIKASTFDAQIWVNAGTKSALYRINGVKLSSTWSLSSRFTGDLTGVSFNVISEGGLGKLQYKNTNSSGTTTIRVRATTNAPKDKNPF